ncbi:MAG: glycoside hydrolase family 3 protein [Agathobacter sp.]|nr:glycoside hydrolase family 3 protein [Agathobacter sp.]
MANGKKNLSIKGAVVRYALSAILSIAMIVAIVVTGMYADLISNVLDADTTKIIGEVEDTYKSDFDSYEDLVKYEEALCEEIASEGIVLVKNNENALPFTKNVKKISVFGQNSVDFVYGGSGSGSVNADKAVSLKAALEKAGYEVNPDLWDFYTKGAGKEYRKTFPSETGAGEFAVNEVPLDVLTSNVSADKMKAYGDAAIVVIGRSGGESSDLPTSKLSTGVMYLEIDPNEEATLKYACDNYENVVVILNSNNAMELDFLEKYAVDACIWIGGIGQTGMYAIGEVLNGTVNPSGRLVDTYAYDSTSAPSFGNIGDYTITNANPESRNTDKYLVYGESIYIGYRYYETRYEDIVIGRANAGQFDYAKEVQYPFGYGLSYTEFGYSDFKVTEDGENFVVSVTVTNNGKVAGKDVVQIYMQSPYTEYDITNGVEKASVELVGFDKTGLLEAGKSETVEIKISKDNMKAYDANGAKTYILDEGDYYFALGTNAHDAINNILAAKGYTTANGMTAEGNAAFTYKHTVTELDSTTYATSAQTGNAITNHLEDVDIRYYDANFKYLTRNDWTGTWPTTYQNGQWAAPDNVIADLEFYRGDDVINDGSTMPTTGKEVTVTVAELAGKEYDDPLWDALLDSLTLNQMTRLVRMGGYATVTIDAVGLPGTADKDGPAGFSSSIVPGRSGMAYPAEVVMASTWNEDLVEDFGRAIGEESLALGITGWYAPGVNIHRSPYSGRNFEYYSEDSFLSGKMAARVTVGARSKGCIPYMKHFALNDQETNRYGLAVFASEQATREIFIKGFEMAATEGDAVAMMAAMNRVGTRWVGAHKGLMTDIVRNEWGFEGMVITDQASVTAMLYQDIVSGLAGGTDLWLNTNTELWSLKEYESNPTVMNNVRKATHNIIYAIANSNAMNGISADSQVVEITPWWQMALYALAAVIWVLSAIVIVKTTLTLKKQKKANE